MIVGNELLHWVRDRERQRETQRSVDSFRAEWNRLPVHMHFQATMATLEDPNADEVAMAMKRLFADDAWIDVLIASLAAPVRDDPYFQPPFLALNSEIHSGLLVYEDDRVQIAVGVCPAAQLAAKKNGGSGGSVNFNGQVTVLKLVRAGDAVLSFWEARRIADDFSAANAGACRKVGEREIADGEILIVDGRSQSYVIEHANANILLIQAAIKVDQAPLSVEYDAATCAYLGCSATSDADSRLQMIATLVRKLGQEGAFAAIAPLADHPRFFVRWHAMRELIGLDAVAALPRLSAMATLDPHPDVRDAARIALERVQGALGGREAA
jgi:hypothetical protein